MKASEWIQQKVIVNDYPKLSSALKVKETKWGCGMPTGYFATLVANSNNIQNNAQNVYLINGGTTQNIGKTFVNSVNFDKCSNLFAARKLIQGSWINDKDEYLAPNNL